MKIFVVFLLSTLSIGALADPPAGEVKVPLATYTALLEELAEESKPAPVAFAIGVSNVRINVSGRDPHDTAEVHVSFGLEVFENEWTLVPFLPAGVALTHASVNGQEWSSWWTGAEVLHWSTARAGRYQADLSYRVDAQTFETGHTLPVPVPSTIATRLRVVFPDTGIDLAVVPAINVVTEEHEGQNHPNRQRAGHFRGNGVLACGNQPPVRDESGPLPRRANR